MKAITFDLDQTLIDFLSFKKKATSSAASAMIKAEGLIMNRDVLARLKSNILVFKR